MIDVGTVLEVLGALGTLVGLGKSAHDAVIVLTERAGSSQPFVFRLAQVAELETIRQRLSSYVPAAQLRSLPDMEQLMSSSRSTYRVLERVHPGTGNSAARSEVVGFAICYQLKAKFRDQLMKGRTDASAIRPSDLSKAKRPSAWYLGFAWGADAVAQGYLCRALDESWRECGNPPFFTRPTTDEALQFVRNNKFKRAKGGGPPEKFEICWRDAPLQKAPPSRILVQRLG